MTKTVILAGDKQRDFALSLVAQAPLGYEVTIAAPQKTRDQEKHYWALCGDFAKQATFNTVKLDSNSWMAIFLDALFEGEGRSIVPSLDGKRFVQLNRSTKRLTKKEASALIEMMYAEGHHRGVVFPDYRHFAERT